MKDLIRLINIPIPPVLDQALGYDGKARYVAFYWEPAGNELAWADGRVSIIGADWHAWLTYIQHPSVAHCLEPYELVQVHATFFAIACLRCSTYLHVK